MKRREFLKALAAVTAAAASGVALLDVEPTEVVRGQFAELFAPGLREIVMRQYSDEANHFHLFYGAHPVVIAGDVLDRL
jgi:hypothetical protein